MKDLIRDIKTVCDSGSDNTDEYLERLINLYVKEKYRKDLPTMDQIESRAIELMKESWSHCFRDGELIQRPRQFEYELELIMKGAKIIIGE